MPLATEVGLGPGRIVLDGDSDPSTERGTPAPTFRAMSIAAKRSPISATAERLFQIGHGYVHEIKFFRVGKNHISSTRNYGVRPACTRTVQTAVANVEKRLITIGNGRCCGCGCR